MSERLVCGSGAWQGTVLMALLQPPPETFDLFDDIILLSDGFVVYHGPRTEVRKHTHSVHPVSCGQHGSLLKSESLRLQC